MDYNGFKNQWNGGRDDYDHVFAYQCVDPILRFLQQVAGVASGVWGNAIDYATRPTQAFINATNKITDGNYQPGDIIVLRTNGTAPGDNSGFGHIGLLDSDEGNSVRLLEQNGATGSGNGTGNDKISVWRSIPKSRIAAAYRLKALTSSPPHNPANDSRIGKVLYLHPVDRWRVYRRGDKPNGTNAIGALAPSRFESGLPAPKNRGLTYNIIGVSQYPNTVTIQTSTYGIVDIYVDSDGEII